MPRSPSPVQFLIHIVSLAIIPITLFTSTALFFPYAAVALELFHILVIGLLYGMQYSDPSMDELQEKRKYGFKPVPYVHRPGHHVIEDQRCRICQIQAPKGTKHCRKCNACIAGFDHHCTWLNMCVGSKNYKLFIAFISLLVADSLLICGWHATMLGLWFSRKDHETKGSDLLSLPSARGLSLAWIGLTLVCIAVGATLAAATGNLLWFHLKLYRTGQSTYYYITQQRKQSRRLHADSSTDSRTMSSGPRAVHPAIARTSDVHDFPPANVIIMDHGGRLPPIHTSSSHPNAANEHRISID